MPTASPNTKNKHPLVNPGIHPIQAVTDGLGNPLHFLLSSGNRNDIYVAQTLLESFDLQGKLILADKGYDSNKFVRWIESRGGIAIIPSRITSKAPRDTDRHIYKERHLIENLFLKLKSGPPRKSQGLE